MNEIEITEEVSISLPRSKPKPEKKVKAKRVKKKTERKLLEQKLDKLVREIVLDRDVRCVCPPPSRGHGNVLQAGHLITRSKEATRWGLDNVHAQCNSCNILHEYMPHIYTNWYVINFGVEKFNSLCESAEKVQKLQLYELQELLEQMRRIRQKQNQATLMGEVFKPYFSQQEILSGAWDK